MTLDVLRYPVRPMNSVELHHVLSCARRVKLHHRLFNAVEFCFDVNRNNEVVLLMRAWVPDRVAPATYDCEVRGEVAYDRDPWRVHGLGYGDRVDAMAYAHNADARIASPERRPMPNVWISIEKPVYIDPCLLDVARVDDLTEFFARLLRTELVWFATHEVDEMLKVDGKQLQDPHSIQRVQVSVKISV